MDVQGATRHPVDRLDGRRTEREVLDVVPVHHVEMEPIHVFLDRTDLLSQVCEVGREYRGSDLETFHMRHPPIRSAPVSRNPRAKSDPAILRFVAGWTSSSDTAAPSPAPTKTL